MFLCRTGRLSAAALDTAFKSSGSFRQRVSANRLGDVTLTLRNANTLQRHRCFCVSVSGVEASLTHLQQRQQQKGDWQPVQSREWSHLDRTVNLSKRVQSEGGYVDVIRRVNRRHDSRAELMVHGVFTGDWELSSRLLSTGTMQVRGLSTQRREASEEQPANNKEGEQNLTEAPATSSHPATAQREQEPEGGKPNKTQQLKTVFKEYGAVGVSFHITISLMSLGMFYLLISSGIDMAALLCKLGFSEAVVRSKMAAGTSTFVLAYAIHKLFAPVRISITLVSVPLIVRYFRKTGHFKPPTPAP